MPRAHLGPTQPPIQFVPGDLSLGVKRPGRKAAHSSPSNSEAKNEWCYSSTPSIFLYGVYRHNFLLVNKVCQEITRYSMSLFRCISRTKGPNSYTRLSIRPWCASLSFRYQYALGVRHLAFVTTQTTFAKTSRLLLNSKYQNQTKAVTSIRER